MQTRLALLTVGLAASLSCSAAKPPASGTPANDLTVPVTVHQANCPPPAAAPCVLRKPVGTGYRVLTPDVGIEDNGERWVVDFGKKAAGRQRTSFRIMDMNGDLHDIEVSFAAASTKAKAVRK